MKPDQRINNADNFVEEITQIVMRPVIGILMRCGLSFNRFADICRTVYVDVAASEFGIEGRRTNKSRIALLTGLSRLRVKQELDRLSGRAAVAATAAEMDQVRPASRMLMAWHTDPEFLDEHGKPLDLPPQRGTPSFTDLYEKYSGKVVPITAMLKELASVGALKTTDDGSLRVLMRSYMPRQSDPQAARRVCMAVGDLAETAAHNLFGDGDNATRFERFATNQLIPVSEVEEFTRFLNEEGQAFLERADDWLAQHESQDPGAKVVRIGVGVYQIAPEQPITGRKK